MKILNFESLPSTNEYAKTYPNREEIIIVADEQVAGRGSKNRSFISGMGGLYLTKLTYPVALLASNVFEIMCSTTVAVCQTLEFFGLTPTVKWPNDVYVNGKKICGILIENTFSGNVVSRSIVGVGLNVNNVLPSELIEIATTMQNESGKTILIDEVKALLIDNLQKTYSLAEYKNYVHFLGEKITLLQNEIVREVTAKDVDKIGRLIVEENSKVYPVTAGEVSLRFIK